MSGSDPRTGFYLDSRGALVAGGLSGRGRDEEDLGLEIWGLAILTRDPARTDVTIEVQTNGGLDGPWTTIAASALGTPFTGPGYVGGDGAAPGLKSVEIRDTVNLLNAPRRFLRVRVTR